LRLFENSGVARLAESDVQTDERCAQSLIPNTG